MNELPSVYIVGAAAVIISTIKLDDWKQVELQAPEATELVDEDGDMIYRAICGTGTGSITDSGIIWGSYVTDEGFATVTLLLDEAVEDATAAVLEHIADYLVHLAKIETKTREVLYATGFIAEKSGFQLIRI